MASAKPCPSYVDKCTPQITWILELVSFDSLCNPFWFAVSAHHSICLKKKKKNWPYLIHTMSTAMPHSTFGMLCTVPDHLTHRGSALHKMAASSILHCVLNMSIWADMHAHTWLLYIYVDTHWRRCTDKDVSLAHQTLPFHRHIVQLQNITQVIMLRDS